LVSVPILGERKQKRIAAGGNCGSDFSKSGQLKRLVTKKTFDRDELLYLALFQIVSQAKIADSWCAMIGRASPVVGNSRIRSLLETTLETRPDFALAKG